METKEIQRNSYTNISKRNKAILPLVISFTLIFMISFASITYSWVFSTQFSDISGVNIVLGQSQGLVMTINGNVAESISINNYLGAAMSTFSLKEASTENGRDLFLRDSGMYYDDIDNIYENEDVARDEIGIIQFREAEESDQNVNFIYFYVNLEAVGDNRYLIFNAETSYIKDIYDELIYPIRTSITFVEGETVDTKIIGNRQEYTGNYSTAAIGYIDADTKVGHNTNQNVETFYGYTGYENEVFDANRTLYYLPNGEQVHVIFRIWLEGGDPLCTNAIAGSHLNISLQFDNIAESEVSE